MRYIGQGTFGQTFGCRNIVTGQRVAMKVIRSTNKFYEQGKNEHRALSWVSKQNKEITSLITYLLDSTDHYHHHIFIMPLYEFSLHGLIQANCQGIPLSGIRVVACSVGNNNNNELPVLDFSHCL